MGSFIYIFLSVKIFYPSLNDFGIDLGGSETEHIFNRWLLSGHMSFIMDTTSTSCQTVTACPFSLLSLQRSKILILKNSPTCFSSVMVFISKAHKICASPKTDDNMFQVPEVSVFRKL